MKNKPTVTDVLFWGILAAFIVIIGGYVFTLTSTIATSL